MQTKALLPSLTTQQTDWEETDAVQGVGQTW
jgi:hypothetical protein